MESRNDDDVFSNLSKEMWGEIAKNPATIIKLSRSSKYCHAYFSETGELKLALGLLQKLLGSAALGEWKEAESIWKLFPDLLTCPGTVYHPNRTYAEGDPEDIPFDKNPGRYKYVDRSAWQIAVMNEEYEEAEGMEKQMTEEERKMQFNVIFPEGEIVKYIGCDMLPDGKIVRHRFDLEKAKELLLAAFDEIKKDKDIDGYDMEKMSESTRKALQALRFYAKPMAEHDTGLVSDANFYLEALKLYDDNRSNFGNWKRRAFWCNRVEEWLAGCLGTGYLRPHAHGIGYPATRAGCVLTGDDNSSYFSFRRSNSSLPGFHFFVGYFGSLSYSGDWGWGVRGVKGWGAVAFLKLMSSKNESKDRLYAAICASGNIVVP